MKNRSDLWSHWTPKNGSIWRGMVVGLAGATVFWGAAWLIATIW